MAPATGEVANKPSGVPHKVPLPLPTPQREKVWRAIETKTLTRTKADKAEVVTMDKRPANGANSVTGASGVLPDLPAGSTDIVLAPENVQAYCASALAPAQVFWLRADRDTVVLGQQGTVVGVPAGAWELPAGGKIRVELREFYSISDILLAGLSTMSGTNVLETGGMVYISATADNQAVALRSGRRLLLRMPTTRKQERMQLFQGVGSQLHGLYWQLPPASAVKQAVKVDLEKKQVDGFDLEKDSRWPQLPGSEKALLKFFDQRVPLTPSTLARLRYPRTISPEEKTMLRVYAFC